MQERKKGYMRNIRSAGRKEGVQKEYKGCRREIQYEVQEGYECCRRDIRGAGRKEGVQKEYKGCRRETRGAGGI